MEYIRESRQSYVQIRCLEETEAEAKHALLVPKPGATGDPDVVAR